MSPEDGDSGASVGHELGPALPTGQAGAWCGTAVLQPLKEPSAGTELLDPPIRGAAVGASSNASAHRSSHEKEHATGGNGLRAVGSSGTGSACITGSLNIAVRRWSGMSEPTSAPDAIDEASAAFRDRHDLEAIMADAEPFREDESFEIADLTDEEWAAFVQAIHE